MILNKHRSKIKLSAEIARHCAILTQFKFAIITLTVIIVNLILNNFVKFATNINHIKLIRKTIKQKNDQEVSFIQENSTVITETINMRQKKKKH